jgi:hypothetical protein
MLCAEVRDGRASYPGVGSLVQIRAGPEQLTLALQGLFLRESGKPGRGDAEARVDLLRRWKECQSLGQSGQ